MPPVSLTVTHPRADYAEVPGPSRRVTFTGAQVGQVTGAVGEVWEAPITDPAVQHQDLAGNWVQLPRPGLKPLLRWQGPKLHVYSLTIWLDDEYSTSGDTEVDLHTLNNTWGGGTDQPSVLSVSYSGFEGFAGGPFWSITDMQIKTVRRRQGDNKIVRATATITLTEQPEGVYLAPVQSSPPPVLVSTAPTPTSVAAAAGSGKAPAPKAGSGPRTYTVRAGDSLWSISTRFYGTGVYWTKIGDANHLTSTLIHPGQVLVIP